LPILLISASWVGRFIGMSHHHPAQICLWQQLLWSLRNILESINGQIFPVQYRGHFYILGFCFF
jgi:hypothetical protein